ncbi:MAG TPA: isoprenylcysteine carboxylmethyltransferase family protein [Syntrophorhabdaceae bacterium]|nr:isoprenylcysteine carboxylmethyltransferase family protein [Syntrophorhabdaceae bacterium]
MKRREKLFGMGPRGTAISIILLAIAFYVNGRLGRPAMLANPAPLKVAGMLFICVGLMLYIASVHRLRNWWRNDELCTSGPFRWFRHPMYASWITFILPGVALYSNSWVILCCAIVLHPIWHLFVAREEKMMMETFQDQYKTYAAGTGRFIPRIRCS